MTVATKLLAFPVQSSSTDVGPQRTGAQDAPARRCRGCDGACEFAGGCKARQASAAKAAAKASSENVVRLTLAN